jgi:ABC-type branched-subunit amino acid transport system substrate-binding protein
MAAANIDPLIQQIKADDDVVDSAVILINGFVARMQAAVDAALANGATGAELQPLTDEIALQKSKTQALADAVAANTPPPAPQATAHHSRKP